MSPNTIAFPITLRDCDHRLSLSFGFRRERTPGFFFAAVEYLDASVSPVRYCCCVVPSAAEHDRASMIVLQNHKVVRAIEAEAAEEKSNEGDARSIGAAPVVATKMVIPDVDG